LTTFFGATFLTTWCGGRWMVGDERWWVVGEWWVGMWVGMWVVLRAMVLLSRE